jgi:hypothetical protein
MTLSRFFLVGGLCVAAALTSGCEKKITAVCEAKCGGDAQTCVDFYEKAEATAEERGCEGAFEEFASCADAKASCKEGVLDTTGCGSEINELEECVEPNW